MRQFVNLIRIIMLLSALVSAYGYPVFGQGDTAKSDVLLDPRLRQIDTKEAGTGISPGIKTDPTTGLQRDTESNEVPPPPAVALPDHRRLIYHQTAESLAWRGRALSLADEYPLKKNSLAWELPVTYSRAQFLFKQAAKQTGLTMVSEYPEAGQFLLSEAGEKGEIIVVSQPISDSRTLFKMHVYSNEHSLDNQRANDLGAVMKDLSKDKELWQ